MRFKPVALLFLLIFPAMQLISTDIPGNQLIGSGRKLITNYSNLDYDHYSQNWAIVQDSRGVIYVANQAGILEYDGVTWRVIYIPNMAVRSLAIDERGTIFVGGNNEIGYLSASEKGTLEYVSLVDRLTGREKEFSYVRGVHATGNGVYFESEEYIFHFDVQSGKVTPIKAENRFLFSSHCNETFFVQEENAGLLYEVGNEFRSVPGGDIFSNAEIFVMTPFDEQGEKLLIATMEKGLYLYDGTKFQVFATGIAPFLEQQRLYQGTRLSSGEFAFATRKGGLVIIDSMGKLKHIYNKQAGLQDENVKNVFQDYNGNLWLPLQNGISKIEYNSPLGIYNDTDGLRGTVLSITKHRGKLIAGTEYGIFILGENGRFIPLPGFSTHCWSFLSVGSQLLAATASGVFQIDGAGPGGLINREICRHYSLFLLQSITDSNRIWVGTIRGLISLYLNEKTNLWELEKTFDSIGQEISFIAETHKGSLWLATRTKGVANVSFTRKPTMPITKWYYKEQGLPEGEIGVFRAGGRVLFATGKGLYRFDDKDRRFIPDKILGDDFAGGSRNVFRLAEDKNKNIWFHSRGRDFQAVVQGKTYVVNGNPFMRLPNHNVNMIFPDPDGDIVYFAENNGLICFNTRYNREYDQAFSALIRRVQLINREDILFDGLAPKPMETGFERNPYSPLEYEDRNIRFQFAAPFFEDETATKYRFRLEGYEKHWSDWTSETQKDYTNIDFGDHVFNVQAKNIYGKVSKKAVYSFKINPPWYHTWWAYSIYITLLLLLFFLSLRWRSRNLEKEKQQLENIIENRTHEIYAKNLQLEIQSKKLKEMDKIKSRFFANISHEFRTPLTLIMGPLEKILTDDEVEKPEYLKKDAAVMLQNTRRLLHLVNQLLDLSRLESGKMKLNASLQNAVPFLKTIAQAFESLVNQKNLQLVFEAEQEDMILYFDVEKMEKVLGNLLSNAIKFTPVHGQVTVSVKMSRNETSGFPNGVLVISVTDTGPGIPGDQLAHIFERFYQAENTYEYHQKGTGIGLALTKELVALHHGTIEVSSTKGQGSRFVIRLPLGDAHLSPGQLVKPVTTPGVIDLSFSTVLSEQMSTGDCDKTATEPDGNALQAGKNIILLVEDSIEMRNYIKEAFITDYEVVEATDGIKGLEKAREIIPDLIISDIMMPGMDGYELCRKIKGDKSTSHIPVILLTARAAEENVVQGLETGADDYVTKPFSTKILNARVKNLIEIRSQLQSNVNRELTLQPAKTSISKLDREFLNELTHVIDRNLSDPEFNVEELCKKLYMSNTTIYRKILALCGQTPTEFIRSNRLKRSVQLLKANFGSVTEIAFEVGFSSRAYFTKCFKEKFHTLPSEYQEANKQ